MKKIVRDALILFLITLVAGVALGAVHEITLDPIAKAQQDAANATYREVFPEAAAFESTDALDAAVEACNADPKLQEFGSNVSVDYALEARDASGQVLGYVVAASAKGYGGAVQEAIGISSAIQITGLGFLSISETPGLGMKADTADWRSRRARTTRSRPSPARHSRPRP